MADESPASFQLCKSTPYKNIEARKCAGCEVMFEPSRKNQRYHNEQCRKKSENRRRRGPSFTERVIAVKGRKCGKCGSEREGRRTAFYWDPSEANIDRAAVLCPSCLKWAHRKRRGQLNSCKLVSDYAEMAKDERAYQEANGCCILDAEGAGVIDGPPQVINRSNLDEASRQTHPRELFCRHCEERLCQISPDGDVIAIDKREVVLKDRAVACSRCRDVAAAAAWHPGRIRRRRQRRHRR